MNVSPGYVKYRQQVLNYEARTAFSGDASVPKFAHDDQLCAAVRRAAPGGMPIRNVEPGDPHLGWDFTADGRPWRQAKETPELGLIAWIPRGGTTA